VHSKIFGFYTYNRVIEGAHQLRELPVHFSVHQEYCALKKNQRKTLKNFPVQDRKFKTGSLV